MSWERALLQRLIWNQTVQREDGMLNEVRTWHMVTGINMYVFVWISLGYNYEHMHLMMMMMMKNLMLMTLYFCFIHVLRHFCLCVYVIALLGGTWVLFSKWNRKLLKNDKGFLKILLLVSMVFFLGGGVPELHNLMKSTGGYLITTIVNTVILYMHFKHCRIIDQFYLVCCWDYNVGEGGGKGEVKEKGRRKSLCLIKQHYLQT